MSLPSAGRHHTTFDPAITIRRPSFGFPATFLWTLRMHVRRASYRSFWRGGPDELSKLEVEERTDFNFEFPIQRYI